jgi:quercetin dioxygenase-like cupin family protein
MTRVLSIGLHRDQPGAISTTLSTSLVRIGRRATTTGPNAVRPERPLRRVRPANWTPPAITVVAVVGALCSSAVFAHEKTPPQVTEKARLVLPDNVQWQSCSPEGAKPEEECEYFVLSGNPEEGAAGQYVRLPNRCALGKHWETSPMHLVGLNGEFIYQFEDGPEMFLTPGAYIYVPENKVHSERCGDEGALFYLYTEKPLKTHMVAE